MNFFRAHRRTLILLLIGYVVFAGSAFYVAGHVRILPGAKGCDLLNTVDRRAECYADLIESRASDGSLVAALEWADDQVHRESQQMKDDCHMGAHLVGKDLVKTEAGRAQILEVKNTAGRCSSSVTHELLRWMIAQRGGVATPEMLRTVCPTTTGRAYILCVHSVGHAFVLNGDTKGFVESCRQLIPAAEGATRSNCYVGGFMEAEKELEIRKSGRRVEETCAVPTQREDYTCYGWIAGIHAAEQKMTSAEIVDYCAGLRGNPENQRGCLRTIGDYVDDGPTEIKACDRLTGHEIRAACAFGVYAEGILLEYSDASFRPDSSISATWPSTTCTDPDLPAGFAEGCAAAWGSYSRGSSEVTETVDTSACTVSGWNADLRDWCLQAINWCWPYHSIESCRASATPPSRRTT